MVREDYRKVGMHSSRMNITHAMNAAGGTNSRNGNDAVAYH